MLVGITGAARSGKNAVASILAEIAGFQTVGFADALREMALGIDPVVHAEDSITGIVVMRYSEAIREYGYDGAKEMPEVRRFLQRLGTEGGRKVFGENFWIEQVAKRVRGIQRGGTQNIVLPDVRFFNEADYVASMGGSLWRTVRTGYNSELGNNAAHASETEMNGIVADYTLYASNLDELRAEVERVYKLTQQLMEARA